MNSETESSSVQDTILKTFCCVDFIAYTLTLGFAVHNSVRYLVMQGRWENHFLTVFYTLTIMICLTRICFFYFEFMFLKTHQGSGDVTYWRKMVVTTSSAAFTMKAILGVFQINSMVELVIELRISAGLIA